MGFRKKLRIQDESPARTPTGEIQPSQCATAQCSSIEQSYIGINNNAFSSEGEPELRYGTDLSRNRQEFLHLEAMPANQNINGRQVSVTSAGDAIIVRDAHKSYTSGQPVLNGLNLTVPCGSIYGLLGSSGCGKTTMLSCIVGQRKLDRGEILIFGKEPGTESIGVPGRNVGYMPQEISLYMEFSIGETFQYFGTLSGMSKKEVQTATTFFIKLLDLPMESRRISILSGGQKRRVSIAVALLHKPAIVVLDEPTVGVDPLLRERIWQYLQELVQTRCSTIIITTHYIEECRNADNIGLIRNGRLLIERQPKDLFLEYGSTNLEKIVLQISRADTQAGIGTHTDNLRHRTTERNARKNGNEAIKDFANNNSTSYPTIKMAPVLQEFQQGSQDSFIRIRALTGKNFAILLRNPLLLFFVVFIAALMVTLVCLALGDKPHQTPIGLVNHEVDYFKVCPTVTRVADECNVENLSCAILSHLPPRSLQLKVLSNEDDAIREVQTGNIWGYIVFPPNFSIALYERFTAGSTVEERTYNGSQIIVRLDETNKQVAGTIKDNLYDAFEDFNRAFLTDCGFDPRQADRTLKYGEPLFGNEDTTFGEFLAGGVAPSIIFFFPIITTSIRYISEKRNGVLDRSLVGGVQTWEIMVAYSISEFFVLSLQSLINYAVIRVIFQIEILGSHFQLVLLFLLSGYGGVGMGFLLGSVCTQEIQAAVLAMAAFFPNFILAGIVWPAEGMWIGLQYFVQVLPCMKAGEAARSIVSRGWEFTHPSVWPGFVILTAYIFGYFLLTVLYHVVRKK